MLLGHPTGALARLPSKELRATTGYHPTLRFAHRQQLTQGNLESKEFHANAISEIPGTLKNAEMPRYNLK